MTDVSVSASLQSWRVCFYVSLSRLNFDELPDSGESNIFVSICSVKYHIYKYVL